MAFPTTGILDAFTRGDNASLGANWTEGDIEPDGPNGATFEIVSNACNNTAGLSASARWIGASGVETFGPDCEVYATLNTVPVDDGTRYMIHGRITTPGSTTFEGYGLCVRLLEGGSIQQFRLIKWTNGGRADLATQAVTFNAGDKMGLEIVNSGSDVILRGYRFNGSTWSQEITHTDTAPGSPYTLAGYLGVSDSLSGSNDMHIDDFGGGTVVAGGAPVDTEATMRQAGRIQAETSVEVTVPLPFHAIEFVEATA